MHLGFRFDKDGRQFYDPQNAISKSFNPLEFFAKPCLWKAGKVIAYLDWNTFKKTVDGRYLSQQKKLLDNANFMIEFPKMYYRYSSLECVEKDRYFEFEVSDRKEDLKFESPVSAFKYVKSRTGRNLDAFYVGVYEGSIDNNGKLKSLPDQKITPGLSVNDYIEAARKTYRYCTIMNLEQFTYILFLSLLADFFMEKSKAEISDELPSRSIPITGSTESKGMFFEDQKNKGIKTFGLENFLCNYKELVLPCSTDRSTLTQLTKIIEDAFVIKCPKRRDTKNPGCVARLVGIKKSLDK